MTEFSPEMEQLLKARDPVAMGLLFDAVFDRVWAFIRRAVSDTATTEDLVQDVFLSVQTSIERYDFQRPIVPWVYAIASNKLKDHWRRRGSGLVSTSLDAAGEEASSLNLSGPNLSGEAIGGERLEELECALDSLPEDLRLIVELRVFQDLPYVEVAGILELSEAATRKRFSRAISALRSALEGPAPASS